MAESRATFNKYGAPGLFAVCKDSYKRYPATWQQLVAMRTSKKAYEEAGFVSGFGHMVVKPEGTPFSFDERIQGAIKRWVHDTYALGVRITQEAIEDDQYGIMKTAMKDLGTSAAATRHLAAIRPFMTGETPVYHVGGDGLPLFSDVHPRLDGGPVWSNLMPAANPTEASLEAAILNFENITDHRGKRYDQKVESVWSGKRWEFTFEKLLGSEFEPETPNNAVNAIKRRRKLKLVIDPEITDERWGVMGRKDSDVGVIWFDRIKPSASRHGDPNTGDALFVIRSRWSVEGNDPRMYLMVPGI